MIGDKIKERRLELNLTQAQLSKLTGIKSTTISNYENNISSPSDENIYKFMEVLKCDANFLFEWEEVKNFNLSCAEKTRIKKLRQLDAHGTKIVDLVLNEEYARCTSIPESDDDEQKIEIRHSIYKVSAGTGFYLGNNDDWETIYIPDSPEGQKADFALTIQGNSMEPIYFDGDVVLVKEQSAVDIGQIGIFTIEGEGYIKKYGGDRLISLNAEYDDIIFSDYDEERIRCVGKVIGRI